MADRQEERALLEKEMFTYMFRYYFQTEKQGQTGPAEKWQPLRKRRFFKTYLANYYPRHSSLADHLVHGTRTTRKGGQLFNWFDEIIDQNKIVYGRITIDTDTPESGKKKKGVRKDKTGYLLTQYGYMIFRPLPGELLSPRFLHSIGKFFTLRFTINSPGYIDRVRDFLFSHNYPSGFLKYLKVRYAYQVEEFLHDASIHALTTEENQLKKIIYKMILDIVSNLRPRKISTHPRSLDLANVRASIVIMLQVHDLVHYHFPSDYWEWSAPIPPQFELPVSGRTGSALKGPLTQREEEFTFAPRFEMIKALGSGGQGNVYLVRDILDENTERALKTLKARFLPKDFTRLRKEVKALMKIQSNRIIRILDTNIFDYTATSGTDPYFIMEYAGTAPWISTTFSWESPGSA